MRQIPETWRPDWPRLAAQAVNALINRVSKVERRIDLSSLADFANDAEAAAGGVGLGEFYRTGSTLKVRVN